MMDYDFGDLGVGFITLLNCRRVFPKFMSNPISIIVFSIYHCSSEYISLIIVQDFFSGRYGQLWYSYCLNYDLG